MSDVPSFREEDYKLDLAIEKEFDRTFPRVPVHQTMYGGEPSPSGYIFVKAYDMKQFIAKVLVQVKH